MAMSLKCRVREQCDCFTTSRKQHMHARLHCSRLFPTTRRLSRVSSSTLALAILLSSDRSCAAELCQSSTASKITCPDHEAWRPALVHPRGLGYRRRLPSRRRDSPDHNDQPSLGRWFLVRHEGSRLLHVLHPSAVKTICLSPSSMSAMFLS